MQPQPTLPHLGKRTALAVLRATLLGSGGVLIWWLLVLAAGERALGAGLVGLAMMAAFPLAIALSAMSVEAARSRPGAGWALPLTGIAGAFLGLLVFHAILQALAGAAAPLWPDHAAATAAVDGRLPAGAASRAEAAGSVLVWATLTATTLWPALSAHFHRGVRVFALLISVGPLTGLCLWIRALGL